MNVSISILKYWKNCSPSVFSWGKRYSPYCPLDWLISWTQLLSLFNFKWTFSEAVRRRAVSSLVSSIIATGLQSAPINSLHSTTPTCWQAAGRSALTFRIGICLHCTRTPALEITQNHWSILKKSWISYQFIADALMYSHWPEYKADAKAEFVLCARFLLGGCCCLNSMGQTLFIINCSE